MKRGIAVAALLIAAFFFLGRSYFEPELGFVRVAPILYARCTPCHRPDGLGPFPLLTFEDAVAHAPEIAEVVETRYMPPWLPKPGYGAHADSRRLTDDERSTLLAWISVACPEGQGTPPPPPSAPPRGFRSGTPDLVLEMSEPFTMPAEGTDIYRNIVLPVPIETSKRVRAIEVLPGNARVVHHAVINVDRTDSSLALDARDPGIGFTGMYLGNASMPEGQLLVWTPGKTVVGSSALTWTLEPGSYLVLQLHLQPTGRAEEVRSTVGLFFSETPPDPRALIVSLHSQKIDIPANGTFELEQRFVLPQDFEAISVYAHAHFLGKDVQAYATLPDGARVWLLWIDDWDFGWQEEYRFEAPIFLPAGAELVMRWRYDNTAENPRNPARPPVRVLFGDRSKDEMASVWIQGRAKDAASRRAIGLAQFRGDVARELEEASAMAAIDPKNAVRFVTLAAAAARVNQLPAAVEAYVKAEALEPLDPFARSGYAGVLRRLRRFDEAARELQRATTEAPELSELQANLGVTELARGRVAEAIAAHQRAIALRPKNTDAHYNLGNALAERGDLAAARASYQRALELRPEFAAAWTNLGLLEIRAEQVEAAVRALERAAELEPWNESARHNLELARSRLP